MWHNHGDIFNHIYCYLNLYPAARSTEDNVRESTEQ